MQKRPRLLRSTISKLYELQPSICMANMKKYPTIPPDIESIEKTLYRLFNRMNDSPETIFTIEYRVEFEGFGAFETWGNGWVITGKYENTPISVKHSSLEMALYQWLEQYKKLKEEK